MNDTRRVFESVEQPSMPVKMNGKVIGTGTVGKDGCISLDIEDDDAQRLMQDGSVGSLSVDYTSKTITAIMKNRKRKGL